MEKLDWKKVESPYWKPDDNVQTSVVFSNWRIEQKDFGGKGKARYVLTLSVLQAESPEGFEQFNPPKEFSTSSQSFISGVRPAIDAACDHNETTVAVAVTKMSDRKWQVIDLNTILRHPKVRR